MGSGDRSWVSCEKHVLVLGEVFYASSRQRRWGTIDKKTGSVGINAHSLSLSSPPRPGSCCCGGWVFPPLLGLGRRANYPLSLIMMAIRSALRPFAGAATKRAGASLSRSMSSVTIDLKGTFEGHRKYSFTRYYRRAG